MRRKLVALALLYFVATAQVAAAATLPITRESQKDVMITIYNGNLGLVKDVREVRLPAGINEVQFKDVAAQIDPTTVHLKSITDPAGLRILEQNYEYDLVSSGKLMEKYVGKKVRLYGSDGTYVEATLLSTNGPVFDINGQIHLGHHGRIVLPALPDNLVSQPTLVWLLRNQLDRLQRVEASYLTGGITWRADYVMVINASDTRTDLTGWVTVDNKSGTTYGNAALKLVAGDVNRARDPRREGRMMDIAAKAASPAAASRDFASEGFFEYHLYTLDRPATVKDNQTKQMTLLSASAIPVTKRLIFQGQQLYFYNPYGEGSFPKQKVSVSLEIDNAQKNNLGIPLPKGTVRVYKADKDGSLQFIGEDAIDHTAKDEKLTIKMGEAFDVVGTRKQIDFKRIASTVSETAWEIVLRNHKTESVSVRVTEPVPGDWEVLSASHKYEKFDAHTLRFDVTVPKKGETKIIYRARVKM